MIIEIVFVLFIVIIINIFSWFRLKVFGGLSRRARLIFLIVIDIVILAFSIYFFLSGHTL